MFVFQLEACWNFNSNEFQDQCTILEEDNVYDWDDGFEEWDSSTGGKVNDGNDHEITFTIR